MFMFISSDRGDSKCGSVGVWRSIGEVGGENRVGVDGE